MDVGLRVGIITPCDPMLYFFFPTIPSRESTVLFAGAMMRRVGADVVKIFVVYITTDCHDDDLVLYNGERE